jgi:hypothetical protein
VAETDGSGSDLQRGKCGACAPALESQCRQQSLGASAARPTPREARHRRPPRLREAGPSGSDAQRDVVLTPRPGTAVVTELDYEPLVGRRRSLQKNKITVTQAVGSKRAGRGERPAASAGGASLSWDRGIPAIGVCSMLGDALGTIYIDANCHLEHSRDTTPCWNSAAGELRLVKSVRSCVQS